MNIKKNLELLSPAKNVECGIAAINCGADAVYIGAAKFGARVSAGNELKDIEALIKNAHKYRAKVYVTINTILYDNEINEVRSLINRLYSMGTDAIIIQDTGILELDLPPVALFASTQMHNNLKQKIKFLEVAGFQRVILARELSLFEIHDIRENTNIDLEFFIHGALCVSYSGQCYFSHALFGRSGNRGECAQPCRMLYSLEDSKGKKIIKDKYLLSLKDLNLSAYLKELIDSGITSFKIEGRLKDINYVKNITSFYRQKLDQIIEKDDFLTRSSIGKTHFPFISDPERTFNRGYTDYFINGRNRNLASIDTPKSIGKFVGNVKEVNEEFFCIDSEEKLSNGDGICYLGNDRTLLGTNVIKIDGNKIYVQDGSEIVKGTEIFRNRENEFNKELNKKGLKREIDVIFILSKIEDDLFLSCECEDGSKAEIKLGRFEKAENDSLAKNSIIKQLSRTGDTVYHVKEVKFRISEMYFIPVSCINERRRKVLDDLDEIRLENIPVSNKKIEKNSFPYPLKELDYRGNVVNKFAYDFYKRHGVEINESGFEKLKNYSGKAIMRCKYCIKDQFGLCPKNHPSNYKTDIIEPLYLIDKNRRYQLKFNCKDCYMEIIF